MDDDQLPDDVHAERMSGKLVVIAGFILTAIFGLGIGALAFLR